METIRAQTFLNTLVKDSIGQALETFIYMETNCSDHGKVEAGGKCKVSGCRTQLLQCLACNSQYKKKGNHNCYEIKCKNCNKPFRKQHKCKGKTFISDAFAGSTGDSDNNNNNLKKTVECIICSTHVLEHLFEKHKLDHFTVEEDTNDKNETQLPALVVSDQELQNFFACSNQLLEKFKEANEDCYLQDNIQDAHFSSQEFLTYILEKKNYLQKYHNKDYSKTFNRDTSFTVVVATITRDLLLQNPHEEVQLKYHIKNYYQSCRQSFEVACFFFNMKVKLLKEQTQDLEHCNKKEMLLQYINIKEDLKIKLTTNKETGNAATLLRLCNRIAGISQAQTQEIVVPRHVSTNKHQTIGKYEKIKIKMPRKKFRFLKYKKKWFHSKNCDWCVYCQNYKTDLKKHYDSCKNYRKYYYLLHLEQANLKTQQKIMAERFESKDIKLDDQISQPGCEIINKVCKTYREALATHAIKILEKYVVNMTPNVKFDVFYILLMMSSKAVQAVLQLHRKDEAQASFFFATWQINYAISVSGSGDSAIDIISHASELPFSQQDLRILRKCFGLYKMKKIASHETRKCKLVPEIPRRPMSIAATLYYNKVKKSNKEREKELKKCEKLENLKMELTTRVPISVKSKKTKEESLMSVDEIMSAVDTSAATVTDIDTRATVTSDHVSFIENLKHEIKNITIDSKTIASSIQTLFNTRDWYLTCYRKTGKKILYNRSQEIDFALCDLANLQGYYEI